MQHIIAAAVGAGAAAWGFVEFFNWRLGMRARVTAPGGRQVRQSPSDETSLWSGLWWHVTNVLKVAIVVVLSGLAMLAVGLPIVALFSGLVTLAGWMGAGP